MKLRKKNGTGSIFWTRGDKAEVESIFEDDMYGVLFKMGWVIMGFEAMMILSVLLRGGPWPTVRSYFYFGLYVGLFLVTGMFIALLVWLQRKGRGSTAMQINLAFGYSVVLCVWSCFLTLLDQHSGTNLNVFSYILMAMAVFCMFRPWQSILLFGGGFLLLNVLAFVFQESPVFFQSPRNGDSLFVNGLFITLLAIITSVTLYNYRISKKRDQALIQRQYDQISAINQQLNDLAKIDQLTGTGNRRFLEERMQQLGEGPVAGIMLDIDFFKQYNDKYGHQAGDACLRTLGELLRRFAQQEGGFPVRYGGEEFFLCLPGCRDVAEKAEALRSEVEDCGFARDDLPCGYVTVSVGADVEENWRSIGQDEFLCRCDEALYEAKNAGRNRVRLYQHR